MRMKLVIPAVALLATTLAAPAYAQYRRYGPGYQGPAYSGPAYRTRVFRGAYNQRPGDRTPVL